MKPNMKAKRVFTAVAVACVAVLIVAGAIFVPKLIHKADSKDPASVGQLNASPPPDIPPREEWWQVEPANWWKQELDQQQSQTLRDLWGRQITLVKLLRLVWPDVLERLPPEFAAYINDEARLVYWPMEDGIALGMNEALAKGQYVKDGGLSFERSELTPYMGYFIGRAGDELPLYTWEIGRAHV